MSARHTPVSLRVEAHDCGWSSRWLVVSGYHECGNFKVQGDYTDESRARAAIAKATEALRTTAEQDLKDDEPCKSCDGTGNDERDEGFDSRKYPCQECGGTGSTS